MQEPDRPRGLLEPCAATSGKHGSEEGGAGKRRPLSDDRLHWVRDMDYDEDRSQVRTASGPRVMATLRNLTTGLIHASGRTTIAPTLRWVGRNPIRALQFLTQTA